MCVGMSDFLCACFEMGQFISYLCFLAMIFICFNDSIFMPPEDGSKAFPHRVLCKPNWCFFFTTERGGED